MSADRFIASVDFVLRHECVFEKGHEGDLAHVITENVPGDSGGITKFGIDQRNHPHIDVRALTLDAAITIYHDEEWTKCACDALPGRFDTAVFDCAVNMGMWTAIKFLQRALNNNSRTFLAVDGQIGAKTLAAVQLNGTAAVLSDFLRIRTQRYRDLAETPARTKFLQGWLHRVNDLAAFLGLPASGSQPSTLNAPPFQ